MRLSCNATERLGSGALGSDILIDGVGLVLTIGYLMVEAYAAEIVANKGRTVPANVVGYDQESGFGLLRTITPLKLKPMPLGKSAEIKQGDPVLVGNAGGGSNKAPGNMFVPIDRLSSILADLIAAGRTPGPARPWLGINTDEMGGRLLVSRITRRARRRGRASSAAT